MAEVLMKATQHFYDSNLNPKTVRRGQIFAVPNAVRARDFAGLAEKYEGDEQAAPADDAEVGIVGVERKARETPANKMKPSAENKAD